MESGNRRHDGRGAGGDQQLIERQRFSRAERQRFGLRINFVDTWADARIDVKPLVIGGIGGVRWTTSSPLYLPTFSTSTLTITVLSNFITSLDKRAFE
jgi:hypothetical protein